MLTQSIKLSSVKSLFKHTPRSVGEPFHATPEDMETVDTTDAPPPSPQVPIKWLKAPITRATSPVSKCNKCFARSLQKTKHFLKTGR